MIRGIKASTDVISRIWLIMGVLCCLLRIFFLFSVFYSNVNHNIPSLYHGTNNVYCLHVLLKI